MKKKKKLFFSFSLVFFLHVTFIKDRSSISPNRTTPKPPHQKHHLQNPKIWDKYQELLPQTSRGLTNHKRLKKRTNYSEYSKVHLNRD